MSVVPRRAVAAASVLAALSLVAMACGTAAPPAWTYPPAGSPTQSGSPGPGGTPTASPSATVAPSSPTPAATPTPAASAIPGGWTEVGTAPCPDESRFTCVTLAVPKDHFTAGSPTWEVTYAIHRATGERLGTFVVITGGPGSSGISVADGYADAFPEGVEERYDLVFIDQRGIGLSGPVQCPAATAVYYASTARPQDPAQASAVGAAASAFVTDCLAEAQVDPADLPFYATRQAVEDLEAVREHLGADKLHLDGESYGTQFVQYYATAHPDRVATLILDGPVDLTLDGATYYAEAARAFDDVLTATLNACTTDEACLADHEGSTPLATYDALAARLAEAPIPFDYPMPDGTTEARTLTLADLENAAVSYLYSPFDRWLLQRALASAVDESYVPLARLAYEGIAIDPDTLEAIPDPTYSDALYYAVQCQDYVYNGGVPDGDERLEAFLETGRVLGVDRLRFGAIYYGDLPCIYWPNDPPVDPRPAPIVDPPYPTIVLGATGDPITPLANVTRLANRLTDVHQFVTTGGPHITFGWGEACPDEAIGAYLLEGTLPPGPVTICEGAIVDDYVPVARDTSADYATALELTASIDDQVVGSDDYNYRLEDEPLVVGCDRGGTMTYTPTDAGTDLAFSACEWTEDLPVTGTGAIDDETGGLTMEITAPDGAMTYSRDGDGNRRVTGTFRDEAVDATG